jgi:hypothetical protein
MYGEAAYPAEVKELFTHKPPPTRGELLQQCREQIQKISSTYAEHPMVKSLTMQVEVCEENLKGWKSAKPKSFESKFFQDLMPDLFRTLIETREGVKRLLQGGKAKKSRGRPPDHFGGGGGGAAGGAAGGGNNRSHSTGAIRQEPTSRRLPAVYSQQLEVQVVVGQTVVVHAAEKKDVFHWIL